MIIQNEREPPVAAGQKAMESKKYLVVKNHVREVAEEASTKCENSEEPSSINEEPSKRKKRKKSEKQTSSDGNSSSRDNSNEISESDLEELRRVYKKCKSVLLRIESKYGHLLNSDEYCASRNWKLENAPENECKCALNTKVVFNENGDIIQAVDSSHEHHICPDKLQTFSRYSVPKVQIETEHSSITLPDTIQELENMLKEPLSASLRHRVIQKMKLIRQVNLNMIRFDRQNLMEKLKVNPDEIFDFKGTNLATIAGYPTKPL